MGGINKVMLIGNLGQDPETRALPSGRLVANFSIATNRRFKDKEGQLQQQTEWHRVVAYGRTAELSRDYLQKGRQVFVEGRLQSREWQDKEGHKRTTTEVIIENLQLLGSARQDEAPGFEKAESGPDEDGIPF
jgi:single-strand DNA-binding protein